MKQLRYITLFSILEFYPDWRMQAMQQVEPYICYKAANTNIPGYSHDDIAQELRMHLWDKLIHFDSTKSRLITWSVWLCNRKIIDLDRRMTKTQKRKDYLAESLDELINSEIRIILCERKEN